MRRGAEPVGAEENFDVWRQLELHIAEGDELGSKKPIPGFAPYKAQMPLLFDVAETLAKSPETPYSKFRRCAHFCCT